VKAGDVLTVALESGVRVLRVVDLGERRGPAPEAQALYEDLTPPAESAAPAPGRVGPRPSKRDRRRLDSLRAEEPSAPGDEPASPGRREGW
jgi:ribosome-associated heat shock protein Hsp15